MKDIICDVCFEEYQATGGLIPRQLECGHSCCTNCLTILMRSSRCCMKCRKKLTKTTAQEYPINHCLQEAVKTLDNVSKSQKEFIKNSLADLLGIVEEENVPIEKLNTLEENIKKLSDQLTELTLHIDPKQDPKLKLETAKSDYDFLSEIVIRVRSGEEIYAVAELNDTQKFSKLSATDDRLFVHAFQEGAVMAQRTRNFVQFNDLKKCSKKNIRAFITVQRIERGNQTLCIKLKDSNRVQDFLRLCTGESQTCLKGLPYVQGSPAAFVEYRDNRMIIFPFKSVLKVENASFDTTPSSCLEYVIAEERKTRVDTDSLVCVLNPDRSFHILGTAANVSMKNVVGVIEDTSRSFLSDFYDNISHREGSVIQDCGIIIHVERPEPIEKKMSDIYGSMNVLSSNSIWRLGHSSE